MADSGLLDIRFRGLSQRKSLFGYDAGDCSIASNVAFDKIGRLTKRPGQSSAVATTAICDKQVGALVGPAALTPPVIGCFQFGNEEVRLASDNRLYSLAGAGTKQLSRDYFSEAVGTRRPLQNLSGALDYLAPDVAVTTSGYEVYAWCAVAGEFAGASPIYTLVYEQATGAQVLQPSAPLNQAATGGVWTPKLAVVGGTLVVCVYADIAGNLYMRTMDTSGSQPFAWGTETVLMAAAGAAPLLSTPVYDVTVMPGDTHFACAWTTAVGGGHFGIYVQLFTAAGVAAATTSRSTFPNHAASLVSTSAIPLITLCGLTTDSLFVSWCIQDNASNWEVGVWGLNPSTLAQSFAPTNMLGVAQSAVTLPQQLGGCTVPSAGYGITGTGAIFVFGADDSVNNSIPVSWVLFVNSAGSVTNLAGPQLNWWPMSRPFFRTKNGITKTYCMAYYPSQVQGTYFLVDLNTDNAQAQFAGGDRWARPICTLANRLANSVGATQLRPNNSLCAMPPMSTTSSHWVTPGHVLAGGGNLLQYRLWRLQVDFAHPNRGVTGALGHASVFGSNFYDGQRAIELGHFLFPEGYSLTDSGSGGNLSAGVYSYICIYSWTSASGDTFRSTSFGLSNGSPPTQNVTITLAAGHKVTVGLLFSPPMTTMADAESNTGCGQNTYPISTIIGAVNVEVYRTIANGTTYYLAGTVAVPNQQALGVSGQTTYLDNLSDANLQVNAELYFVPGGTGQLEAVAPPSFSHTIVYVQRIWGIGDDQRTIWYSKQYADGEAPGFNEELTLQVEDGTDVVALAGLQTQLLICTKASWYVVYGTGPDDSGAGNDLTQPQPLVFEQLCSNIRSLVLFPGGLVYQGNNGQLYLIDTSLNCAWFSSRVEDSLRSFPVVTSALWVPSRHELRFTCTNAAGSAGIVLVYNTFVDGWTTWSLGAGTPPSGMTISMIGGVATVRWSDPTYLWSEDTTATVYTDALAGGGTTAWVTADIEVGWMNLPSVIGSYARIRRVVSVGEQFSPHNMTLSYGSNYNPSYSGQTGQSNLWTDATTTGLVPEELRLTPSNQTAHSFRVRMTDGAPTAGGAIGTGQGCSFASVSIEYAPDDGIGKYTSTAQQG